MTVRLRIDPERLLHGSKRAQRQRWGSGRDVFLGRETVVLVADGTGRRSETMRWGFPPFEGKRVIGHVANTSSPFWRPWLKPPWRCVVPASAFAEWSAADARQHWFRRRDQDVLWLAGVWRRLSGSRAMPALPTPEDPGVFALLNSPPNAAFSVLARGSMPTILRASEVDTWLTAPKDIALELKRSTRPEDLLDFST